MRLILKVLKVTLSTEVNKNSKINGMIQEYLDLI